MQYPANYLDELTFPNMLKKHASYIALLTCSFLFLFIACAQSQSSNEIITNDAYNIRQYTVENGLPQNSVKKIVRDPEGFIWLATEGGLVRYDGRNFFNFDSFGGAYSDRNIAAFYSCPDKNCSGRFFAMNDEGTFIKIGEGRASIDTSQYLRKIFHDQAISPAAYLSKGLPDLVKNYVDPKYYIITVASSRQFVCSKNKVQYIENQVVKRTYHFKSQSFWSFFRLNDELYYLFDDGSIVHFNNQGAVVTAGIKEDLSGKALAGLKSDQYQIFWNNCSDQVFILVKDKFYFLQRSLNGNLSADLILNGFDFKANNIKTAFYNKNNSRIFLGSQTKGLFVLDRKQFTAIRGNIKGADNVYYAQSKYKGGTLSAQGIAYKTGRSGRDIIFSQMPLITKATKLDKYSILTDRRGFIWSKSRTKLYQFDRNGKNIILEWDLKEDISHLYEGTDGKIWLGMKYAGLYVIDPYERSPVLRLFAKGPLTRISWIEQQSADILWVGTGQGLYKVFLKTHRTAEVKQFKGIYVRSLYASFPDELWISTYKNGFYLLKGRRLTHFPMDKNGYVASTHCIVEDKNGFIWLTTNKGLFQVLKSDLLTYTRNPFELYYQYYSRINGFNTNEFNGGCQPCGLRLDNGYLSLPSLDGLVWFVPEKIRAELPFHKIFLDQVTINNKPFAFTGDTVWLDTQPDQISLRLSTPYFNDYYNLKMSYSLTENNEKIQAWFPLDNQDLTVTIPRLRPGNYTLKIRKSKGFGVDNYAYKTISINIRKEWYQSLWAILFGLLCLLLLVHTFIRFRTRRLKKRNILLQKQVYAHTRHLQQTVQALSSSEKELQHQLRLQMQMIASISHDIRTPLRFISSLAKEIQRQIENGQTDKIIKVNEMIAYTSDEMSGLIERMITFMKPKVYGNQIALKKTYLLPLVIESISIFSEIIKAHQGNISINIAPNTSVNTNAKLLGVVIHNLTDNAIKARSSNRISIYTRYLEGELHLVISDQGSGMPAAMIQWLNLHEPADAAEPDQASYNGLGLLIVKEITQMLGIRLQVENRPGAHVHLIFKS